MNIPGLSIGAGGNQMTPVLCLMNMVDIQELEDDDEYEGVLCDHVASHSGYVVTNLELVLHR